MEAGCKPPLDAVATLQAALLRAEAEFAVACAKAADDQAVIAYQKPQIEKLNRALYGSRAERTARLIDQMELRFEDLAAAVTEDEIAAEQAVAKTTTVAAFARLRKLGEDVTETLEAIPRQWKMIQRVREKFTCRDCEKISQAPGSFHVTPHAGADPGSRLLGPCPSAVLHHGRSGRERPPQGPWQINSGDLAAGPGGGAAHRRAV